MDQLPVLKPRSYRRKPTESIDPDGLTHDQGRVLVEHWRGLDDRQIADKLGLAPSLVRRVQNSPRFQAALARLQKRHAFKVDTQVRRIQEELDRIAFADRTAIYNDDWTIKPLAEWPPECRAALEAAEVQEIFSGRGEERQAVGYLHKYKFSGKLEALRLLMEHHAMLKLRVEHSGPDGGPIPILGDLTPQALQGKTDAELAALYREAVAPPAKQPQAE